MISCTQFIPAYSEGFKYLEEKGGKTQVEAFWAYLSDKYLKDSLIALAKEKGLEGCFEYWGKALSEEAAEFDMTLDEEKGEFVIDMHKCPSKSMLLKAGHMEPYHDYCGHCPALYKRALEPLGFGFDMDMSHVDEAKCRLVIRKNEKNRRGGQENG
jgi:hypothetical protein